MRGDSHNGSRAVFHKNIIGNIQRDLSAIDRVCNIPAGKNTFFLDTGLHPLYFRFVPYIANELSYFFFIRSVFNKLFYHGMLGGKDHIAASENSINPCCKTGKCTLGINYGKIYVHTFRSSYPVALHCPDLLRPFIKLGYVIQKPLGIIRNTEEPLFKFFLVNDRVTSFASAVNYLFIGKHSTA